MTKLSEPSVLAYARHFGLTQTCMIEDQLAICETTLRQADVPWKDETDSHEVKELLKTFDEAAENYLISIGEEPPCFLENVKESIAPYTQRGIDELSDFYNEQLPDPYRLQKLKLSLPILSARGGDVYRDVKKIKKCTNIEFLVENLLDVEKSEQKVSQDDSYFTSEDSRSVLEWCRSQVIAISKQEKLEVCKSTLKYLDDIFSRSSDFPVEPELTPGHPDSIHKALCLRSEPLYIEDEDFELEGEAEVPKSQCPSGDDGPGEEDHSVYTAETIKLATLVDEDFLADGMQVEEDLEELFRQYTHPDDIDTCPLPQSPGSADHSPDKTPPSKRRKLTHESDEGLMVSVNRATVSKSLGIAIENLKLCTPKIPSYHLFELAPLDVALTQSQVSKATALDIVSTDLGQPPIRIPTIQQAMHASTPLVTGITDKYLMNEQTVVSSGSLLWDEPGLWILERDDEEDHFSSAEDYEIEECNSDESLPEKADKLQLPSTFNPFKQRDQVTPPERSIQAREGESDLPLGQLKPSTYTNVKVRHADRPDQDRAIIQSINVRSEIRLSPGAERTATLGEVDHFLCDQSDPPKDLSQEQRTPLRPARHLIHSNVGLKREVPDPKSLLPKSKIRHISLGKISGAESILDDSLTSFLDLRGKQFKLSTLAKSVQPAEPRGDPIRLIQDLLGSPETVSKSHEKAHASRPNQSAGGTE